MAEEKNIAFGLLKGFAEEAKGQFEDAIIEAIFDQVFSGTPLAGLFENGDTEQLDKLSKQIDELMKACRDYFLAQITINIEDNATGIETRWGNVLDDWKSNHKKATSFNDYLKENPKPFQDALQDVANEIENHCKNILNAATNETVLEAVRDKIGDQMSLHDALDVVNPFLQSVTAPIATSMACFKLIKKSIDIDSNVSAVNEATKDFRKAFRSFFGNLDEIGTLIAGLASGGSHVRLMRFVLRNLSTKQIINWDASCNAYRGADYDTSNQFNDCYDFRDGRDSIPEGRNAWSAINYSNAYSIKSLRLSNYEGDGDGWGDADPSQQPRPTNMAGVVTALGRLGRIPQMIPIGGGDEKSYFPFQVFAILPTNFNGQQWDYEQATFMMDAWQNGGYLRSSRTDRGSVDCQYWVIDTSISFSMQVEQPSLETSYEWVKHEGALPTEKLAFGPDPEK